VVVDVQGEGGRVEVAVVAEHVRVQEVEGEPLLLRTGVELALAGGCDRGIDEEQHVLGRDEVTLSLHQAPWSPSPAAPGAGRGMGARAANHCFIGTFRKSHRSPAAGLPTVAEPAAVVPGLFREPTALVRAGVGYREAAPDGKEGPAVFGRKSYTQEQADRGRSAVGEQPAAVLGRRPC
jgi:hypothetical protein